MSVLSFDVIYILQDAAKFGHDTVAKMLVQAGADVSLRNKAGLDALAVARDHKKDAVIAILKKAPQGKKARAKL